MANDHPPRREPIELAPGVVLLPGFDGDGADPFLVPVNALLLGRDRCILVVPGARRAPWAAALGPSARHVDWVLSARPGVTPDVRIALDRCRRAVPLSTLPPWAIDAGRLALLDPPTAPVRSRAVLDVCRRVLFAADAFGAPVLLPATDAGDLDDGYWCDALALHRAWSGHDDAQAAALTHLGLELIVPAFGPVLHGARLEGALAAGLGAPPPTSATRHYAARLDELTGEGC